jgi:hypothetical protein
MRAHEAAHVIDGILTRQCVKRHRIAVLGYVLAGFDGESGEFVGRTEHQEAAIRCLDCGSPMCEHCELRDLKPSEE